MPGLLDARQRYGRTTRCQTAEDFNLRFLGPTSKFSRLVEVFSHFINFQLPKLDEKQANKHVIRSTPLTISCLVGAAHHISTSIHYHPSKTQ